MQYNTGIYYPFVLQFFERLEVFAYESVKKQEELTERIKREVTS